ncbi:hypothetical protein [Herbaspirillum huttiense]|uniref:DUF1418 family protein n=1 Tax=Herbaspirillum huttiense subsp. lycopersici TaxID=3074428 RepID=A0ABU2ERT5_9BURK|nr:hypothetical protein [Herbaspirillum huttiense]MDR9850881.1 hypothetical protein [Herbaspirillum huttiense SE1]
MLAYLQADKLLRMRASSSSLSNSQKLAIGLFKLYGLIMTLVFVCLVLEKLGLLVVVISPVLLVMVVALCCALFVVAAIPAIWPSRLPAPLQPPSSSAQFPPNADSKQTKRPPRSVP